MTLGRVLSTFLQPSVVGDRTDRVQRSVVVACSNSGSKELAMERHNSARGKRSYHLPMAMPFLDVWGIASRWYPYVDYRSYFHLDHDLTLLVVRELVVDRTRSDET